MTEKELLYYEDAISHEKNIIDILNNSLESLENDDLNNFLTEEIELHQKRKELLMNLLKEKSYE